MSATAARDDGNRRRPSGGVASLLDLDPDLGQLLHGPRPARPHTQHGARARRFAFEPPDAAADTDGRV